MKGRHRLYRLRYRLEQQRPQILNPLVPLSRAMIAIVAIEGCMEGSWEVQMQS